MQSFGVYRRLRDVREDCDFTQKYLAKILNVNVTTYYKWEHEIEIMPLRKAVVFSNFTRKKLDYIAGLSDDSSDITNYDILNIKSVGMRLKNIRKKFSLTQKQLANIFGTTQSSVSSYESGKTLILSIYAVELCRMFNISLDWLIFGK